MLQDSRQLNQINNSIAGKVILSIMKRNEEFMKDRKQQTKKKKAIKWFLFFSLPALIIYTVFWVVPIVMTVGISFTDWTGMTKLSKAEFVNIKNYVNLFHDSILRTCIKNNLIYGILIMLIVPISSFILAYIIETFVKRKMFFRTVTYLPAIIPTIVTVMLWKWIYNPQYGLLNKILDLIGLDKLEKGWLTNSASALYAVSFSSVWKTVPVYFVLFLAGLQSVPKDLIEAAVLDGAGRMDTIKNVIIPSIKRIITIVMVLVFIDIFRVFELVYAMTNGGPGYYNTEMILTYAYKTTFTNANAGYGMAMTTSLIIFVIICTALQLRMQNKESD